MDYELLLAIAILAGFGIAVLFERRAKAARARAAAAAPPRIIVLVKMPEAIAPLERREKFATPLDAALQRENLGKVTGSEIAVTVELTELERGVAFVKRELLRLGVPKETTLEFTRNGVHVRESVMELRLEAGQRYRVIKAFTDHDRDDHPVGEEWTFLRSAFVPYHSGMSWFVTFDGVEETHIRLQSIPEEQGEILDNLAEYLVAV
jgi:hypothetical protein